MKKSILAIVLIAALVLCSFTSCSKKDSAQSTTSTASTSSASTKTVVLRLSEVHAEGYPTTLADQEFARLIEEKTNGRIKVEVYSGGTLYGQETEAIEALQQGSIAFARVSASPVASYVPALNVIQLPYLYRDGDHMWAVLNGEIGQGFLDEVQSSGSGLVGLCYYDGGSRNFYTTKPVHCVADLKGLKIRLQNNEMMVEMAKALGANPVTGIGPNDIYSAIQQGTIDGAENNWPTYESKGDYQVAPYFCLDGHTRVPEILLASEDALASLSDEDVAIIKACAKETQEYEIKKWAEREKESEAVVMAGGCVAYTPTAKELQEFQDAMAPLYAKYGKGYEDLIESIINTK